MRCRFSAARSLSGEAGHDRARAASHKVRPAPAMGPAMSDDITDLHIERAEALIALARSRLRPPQREQAIGLLQAAIQAVRQPIVGRQGAEPSQAARAEEKAAQAEADRDEKRRPYEADPLFMYLWRRRYGTRDYQASNLVRFFDRKVAHLIDFETARIN